MRVSVGFSLCLCVIVVVTAGCSDPPPVIVEGEGDAEREGEGEGEGEGDGGGGEGEADALPATSYCEELAPIFCPFYLRCGRMAVDSEEDCEAAVAQSCEAGFEPRFTPLADAGLLTLSRAGLDACAAHLDDVSCDEQFLELSGPCAQIWRGNVDAGGACGLDAESFVCAPGTTCTLDLSFCGVCEVVLDAGAVCRVGDAVVDGSCGPAGFCASSSSDPPDVCAARATVGDACDDALPCVLPAQCGDDGLCHEPAVVGVDDACDRDHRCPYRSRCGADGLCVATVGAGAGCVDDVDCDAGSCVDGACVAAAPGDFPPRCTAP